VSHVVFNERGIIMRYLLLISHGTFAPGLHSVLDMLLGKRDDILSCSMVVGMGADASTENLRVTIEPIRSGDEVVVMADIIGGSPLTNTLNTLDELGLLAKSTAFVGMNLPMAISAVMEKDGTSLAELGRVILGEGKDGMREVELNLGDEDEDV